MMQHVIITSVCYLTHYRTFFCQCNMFWGCFQRVTVKFINIYIYINIFLKKNDGNKNIPKPGKSQRKYTVTRVLTRVVMH